MLTPVQQHFRRRETSRNPAAFSSPCQRNPGGEGLTPHDKGDETLAVAWRGNLNQYQAAKTAQSCAEADIVVTQQSRPAVLLESGSGPAFMSRDRRSLPMVTEVDEEMVLKCRVIVVDSREQAATEKGSY